MVFFANFDSGMTFRDHKECIKFGTFILTWTKLPSANEEKSISKSDVYVLSHPKSQRAGSSHSRMQISPTLLS